MNFSNPVYLRAVCDGRDIKNNEKFIIFVGRSNVGKSSVINTLCHGRFARVSKTPGRTRAIQLFDLKGILLADLPGYGYAAVAKNEKKKWQQLIEQFFDGAFIICAIIIIDCRRGIGVFDQSLLDGFRQKKIPVLLLLNKADKLNHQQQQQTVQQLHSKANDVDILLFSTLRKIGADNARQWISEICKSNTPILS